MLERRSPLRSRRRSGPFPACLLALLCAATAAAQSPSDLSTLWREVPTRRVDSALRSFVAAPVIGNAKTPTPGYREFDLDPVTLQSVIAGVRPKKPSNVGFLPFDLPLDADPVAKPAEITIPSPDGALLRFVIEDSNTLSASLAERHPELRTFRGHLPDQPGADLRLEVTPSGLHALVQQDGHAFYVQPLKYDAKYLDTKTRYASFVRERLRGRVRFKCFTPPPAAALGAGRPAPIPDLKWGDTFRTYRLAMATTSAYTQAVGGTKAAALDAIIQTVDRVNGIYERELAVHLELVPEEDSLIAVDPATDHLHNTDTDKLLGESQALIDRVVGDSNYDIGHMLSTGAGGKAQLGVVMQSGAKATGVTGTDHPTGAFFDVDYVAHEVGHQFGANHTFNGNQSNCATNRNAPTAYEPGSGSTILGYAGVCGADDVQTHSNPYFHGISLLEITRYLAAQGDTPRKLATGIHYPTLEIRAPAFIPLRTPFYLDAAVVGATPGDTWTYAWEEFDLGPQLPLNAPDDGQAPLYRVLTPTPIGTRWFQAPLPTVARSSTYRITARSPQLHGGIVATAGVKFSVVAGAGPFTVLAPNGAPLRSGANRIAWSVAHTDQPPINTGHVAVLLSNDGGHTFPVTLAADAPNTGAAQLDLPASPGPIVVRVQGVGGYFFADSKPTPVH